MRDDERRFARAVGPALLLLLWAGVSFAAGAPVTPVASHKASSASKPASKPASKLPIDVEIDRVELSGITIFTEKDVEAALEIGPGDLLDRSKVIKTAENLQSLYRIHGYEEVSIKSRLERRMTENHVVETVLDFDVTEGKPTRVAEIRFIAEGYRGPSFQRYWEHLSPDLVSRSGLAVGDVFDEEKASNGKRGIQDLLASEEFVGARVDDVRVATSQPPGNAPGTPGTQKVAALAPAARWVSVEFHVDLGERVTFGFRGNKVLATTRLSSLIDEQRELGFGKDYVTSIRDRILDEYKAQGYSHAKIDAYSFNRGPGERHVTYVINEGPRVRIESLFFDGNTVFSSEDLRKHFYEKAAAVVQYNYYSEVDVQKAAELLIEWMKSQGYLSAKLVTVNAFYPDVPRPETPGSQIRLVVYLYEGEQTVVHDVNLPGVHALAPDEVKRILRVQEGAPLDLFSFSEGIEKLKATYRNKGYLGMRITNEGSNSVVTYTSENRLADIRLDVDEGPQFKVSHVQIEGLVKTKEYVVRRELLFREEQVLREPDLLGTEARLHRLGLFSTVEVRALDDPERQGYKIVRISLVEGTPGVVAAGPGLRNDLGVRVFGQAGYTNLWGENHSITLNASVNRRFSQELWVNDPGIPYRFVEYSAQLGYVYPYFLGDLTTFRPTLTTSGTEYFNFDAISDVFALNFERPLDPGKKLTGILTYSLERDEQFNAQQATDDGNLRIGSITPSLRLDLRDNPLSPTKGFWTTASLEYADPILGSQRGIETISYIRLQWRADYYWPMTRDISWYFSIRLGYERSLAPVNDPGDPNSGAIPLIKQFALGGIGSLRGFQEEELNLQNYAIRGYAAYVNYRIQVDLPFTGALRIGPFLDAADLNANTGQTPFMMNYGAGFGFHYQTPVGPVNLDWGFKLNPLPNTATQQFYFSIGII